jgi:hypothetical protein
MLACPQCIEGPSGQDPNPHCLGCLLEPEEEIVDVVVDGYGIASEATVRVTAGHLERLVHAADGWRTR